MSSEDQFEQLSFPAQLTSNFCRGARIRLIKVLVPVLESMAMLLSITSTFNFSKAGSSLQPSATVDAEEAANCSSAQETKANIHGSRGQELDNHDCAAPLQYSKLPGRHKAGQASHQVAWASSF
jgi:hypothetical protein